MGKFIFYIHLLCNTLMILVSVYLCLILLPFVSVTIALILWLSIMLKYDDTQLYVSSDYWFDCDSHEFWSFVYDDQVSVIGEEGVIICQ